MIDITNKICFIKNPKTDTESIVHAIVNSRIDCLKVMAHKPPRELFSIIERFDFSLSEFQFIFVVRNPVTRFLSGVAYEDWSNVPEVKGQSVATILKNTTKYGWKTRDLELNKKYNKFRSSLNCQSIYIPRGQKQIMLLYEHLKEEWESIKLFYKYLDLPNLNSAPIEKRQLTKDEVAMIKEYYSDDYQLWSNLANERGLNIKEREEEWGFR